MSGAARPGLPRLVLAPAGQGHEGPPGAGPRQDVVLGGGSLDDPEVCALLGALRARAGADALRPDTGLLLYSLVRARRPHVVVDHGSFWPDTSIPLATAVRDNGVGETVCWTPGRRSALRARTWLARAGLTPYARVVEHRDALPAEVSGPVDLLVLRGRQECWLAALELLEPLMRPGAQVVAAGQRALPGDYLHRVRASGHYLSFALSIGDGLEVSSRLAFPSRAAEPTRTDRGLSS
ncbi:hypothetical protein [Streptomyces sp. NBC_01497]|uniref:hypothetical protein n=1 Tax=Streptomyces sp. NBC_01497 TaxID=2903885 RepID=UPI002E363165|nr:hypothetical protein [Streptomyces sp. NBC_01497]